MLADNPFLTFRLSIEEGADDDGEVIDPPSLFGP
jgi:hypothetical protein